MAADGLGERLVAPTEEDVAENEEVLIKEELDTEVEPLKLAPDPGRPTTRQVEEHRRVGHIPYRSWCRWCWLGRGRGTQHRHGVGSVVPIVGFDYFFLTKSGVKKKEELSMSDAAIVEARSKGDIVKCLLTRCLASKAIFAHVVHCKGADEDGIVAELAVRDLEWLGHTRVIVKADGEPALQALVHRALTQAKVECKDLAQLTKEDPAAYDSQANGGTEVGVQLVKGMLRTHKLCLESRLDRYIPVDHPIIAWMLEHVTLLLNTLVRGTDGITAWARIRGRPFGQQLVGFGESLLYRYPTKGPRHAPDGNIGALGRDGTFLGYDRFSNTFLIETVDGLVQARSITRKPETERWSADGLAGVRSMPGDARRAPRRQAERFGGPATDQAATTDDARPAPLRQLRINTSDLKEHDHNDPNCPQCQHIQRYGRARAGGQHTAACRDALIEKMKLTERGKARLQMHEDRTTQIMAENLEKSDQQGLGQPAAASAAAAAPGEAPRARGFLERAPDGGPAEPPAPRSARPPEAARVRFTDKANMELEPPSAEGDGWVNVPGGEAAPSTPRGTPQADEPHVDDLTTDPQDEPMGEPEMSGDVDMAFVGCIDHSGTDIGSLEPDIDDCICELLLAQMGSSGRRYRRETTQAARRLVSEIYSPPRVTQLLHETRHKHLMPGFAFDITMVDPVDGQPWDFALEHKRRRARAMIREQRPYVLIGSPMCTQFCTWQKLNEAKSSDKAAVRRAREAAIVHMNFVAELYEEQVQGGRYFVHEHPLWATSWELACISKIMEHPNVTRVRGDQCQFGAEIQSGPHKGQPIKKPSGFMTNAPEIARALNAQCQGSGGRCSRPSGGVHRLCSGKHAKDAAKYPRELCKAMLKGVRNQMHSDGLLKSGCFGLQAPDDDAEVERNLRGPAQGYSGAYRDDLTGQVLNDDLVKAARAKELAFFYSRRVWLKVPKARARAKSGRPPISVRWVDVNKGDDLVPNYRSRLVARQMKALDSSGQSFFAPAPPLEALRTVLSLAATAIGSRRPNWDPQSPRRTQISLVDVKRAYFNAEIDPRDSPTFVELPKEDGDHALMCAQLLRHMYGTRPAADGWQEEYSTLLVTLGFRQGDACPNVFYHSARSIVTSVHGDDFTSTGPCDELNWFEAAVQERYELDIGPRLGPGKDNAKEGRVLNRVVRWHDDRIEYECDPRQIERLVAECGLEGAKPVATPGVKPTFHELEEENNELPSNLTTAFRGAAARGNYLASDRLDVQFACKEVCRWMAHPTLHSWKALKRICRFLNRAPRLVYVFKRQSVDSVDVYTDTDWAGCPKTRKSTSGGCVMLGRHAMKHWSSTQTSISLSSGEAEFAGVIRGAGQGLGYQALLKDLGVQLPVRVWTDSSAAIGICSRQGLGKLRHLDTHTLWVQQAVRTGRIDLRKVAGERNPADLLTKHSISQQKLEELVTLYGCRYTDGRAASAPQVQKGASNRVTMADAEKEISTCEDQEEYPVGSEVPALMPHTAYTPSELARLHPPIPAPADEQLDDLQTDDHDSLLQHGLRIADQIREQTSQQGRRRRPLEDSEASQGDAPHAVGPDLCQGRRRSGATAPTKDVNLVEYQDAHFEYTPNFSESYCGTDTNLAYNRSARRAAQLPSRRQPWTPQSRAAAGRLLEGGVLSADASRSASQTSDCLLLKPLDSSEPYTEASLGVMRSCFVGTNPTNHDRLLCYPTVQFDAHKDDEPACLMLAQAFQCILASDHRV